MKKGKSLLSKIITKNNIQLSKSLLINAMIIYKAYRNNFNKDKDVIDVEYKVIETNK